MGWPDLVEWTIKEIEPNPSSCINQGWLKLSRAKNPSWMNGTQAKFQGKTQSWPNDLPIKPKHKIEGPSWEIHGWTVSHTKIWSQEYKLYLSQSEKQRSTRNVKGNRLETTKHNDPVSLKQLTWIYNAKIKKIMPTMNITWIQRWFLAWYSSRFINLFHFFLASTNQSNLLLLSLSGFPMIFMNYFSLLLVPFHSYIPRILLDFYSFLSSSHWFTPFDSGSWFNRVRDTKNVSSFLLTFP